MKTITDADGQQPTPSSRAELLDRVEVKLDVLCSRVNGDFARNKPIEDTAEQILRLTESYTSQQLKAFHEAVLEALPEKEEHSKNEDRPCNHFCHNAGHNDCLSETRTALESVFKTFKEGSE